MLVKIKSNKKSEFDSVPLLVLKNTTLFPNLVLPLFVGREYSLSAVKHALEFNLPIVAVLQGDISIESEIDSDNDSFLSSVHKVGVLVNVAHVMRVSENEMRVILDTNRRVRVTSLDINRDKKLITASYDAVEDEKSTATEPQLEALRKTIIKAFKNYNSLSSGSLKEPSLDFLQVKDISLFADIVASSLPNNNEYNQEILESLILEDRLNLIYSCIMREINILTLESGIQAKVKSNLSKYQKEHYIREQMEVMKKELEKLDSNNTSYSEKYEALLKKLEVSKQVKEKVSDEIKKLQSTSSYSTEGSVIKGYLDMVFALPWNKYTDSKIKISDSKAILDKHHFGMEKIKERITEYIAVQSRVKRPKGAILCLCGSPGVGKTSLASSVAEVMGKKYEKISLAGMRDEAEIRGHRKTYVGAFSGKIILAIKRAGSMNPVILLDEIDKISESHRGDPALALLEVLDSEQNSTFQDNYLDFDFDLSNVVFIATANSLSIHPALLDRLDIIRVSGYTEREKLSIAKDYLLPKVKKDAGLLENEFRINDQALLKLIRNYTRESGVRELKRTLSKLSRKVLKKILLNEQITATPSVEAVESKTEEPTTKTAETQAQAPQAQAPQAQETKEAQQESQDSTVKPLYGRDAITYKHNSLYVNCLNSKNKSVENLHSIITIEDVESYLGMSQYDFGVTQEKDAIGVVTGLAYTNFGGDLLLIEAVKIKEGKGEVKITGKLGDVMKESVQAAYSYTQANAESFGIDIAEMIKHNTHIHFPEGATPKDGPSAGIAIVTSIISVFTNRNVFRNVAMTGEITLRGEVLPIGGLKEKLMSAARGGITKVIIPMKNAKDLEDIPSEVKENLEITPVSRLEEVIKIAIQGF